MFLFALREVPGDPDRSEIVHRTSMTTGGRMPLLGSQERDGEGIRLIREWIRSRPHYFDAAKPAGPGAVVPGTHRPSISTVFGFSGTPKLLP